MKYFTFGKSHENIIFCDKVSSINSWAKQDFTVTISLDNGTYLSQTFDNADDMAKEVTRILNIISPEEDVKSEFTSPEDKVLVDKDALNTLLIAFNDSIKHSRSINPNTSALVLTTYTRLNSESDAT